MRNRTGVLTVFLALLSTVLVPLPANAVEYDKWYSRTAGFVRHGEYYVKSQGMCVSWIYEGKIRVSFKKSRYGTWGEHTGWSWRNPRLVHPKLTTRFYESCTSGYPYYPTPVKAGSASLSAWLYGSNGVSCKMNPSLAVGLPWAVSVSVTPECGETKRSGRVWGRSIPARPQHVFYEETPRLAARWNVHGSFNTFHEDYDTRCFKPRARIKTWRKFNGEYGGSTRSIAGKPVCVNFHRLARK